MDHTSASKRKHVVRADSHAKDVGKWATGDDYANLHVTSGGRLVVIVCDSRRLYGPDRIGKDDLPLSEDFIHLLHNIRLVNGQLMINSALNADNFHRI